MMVFKCNTTNTVVDAKVRKAHSSGR